jgi:hypothetical protein
VANQQEPSRRAMTSDFLKRLALLVGITLVLSLAVWLMLGLFRGEFNSPTDAIFWGALPHFAVALFLIVFDTGASLSAQIQVLSGKEDRGGNRDKAREPSEAGISNAFLFSTSGVVILLLAAGVGILTTG